MLKTTMPLPYCDNHSEKTTHVHKVKTWADVKQVRATASVAALGRDPSRFKNETTERLDHRAHTGESRI
jgi:hypothetical protein